MRAAAHALPWLAPAGVLALALWAPGGALADVGEGSLRPYFEARVGDAARPDAGAVDGAQIGGGLLMGYGLSFSLSLTARYGFDRTGALTTTRADGSQLSWRQQRHLGLLGLAWAPSDAWTPIVLLEGGVAARRHHDAYSVRPGGRSGEADELIADQWAAVPLGRATVLFEYRLSDFISVSPGAVVELAEDRLSYGGQLWLALYHYL